MSKTYSLLCALGLCLLLVGVSSAQTAHVTTLYTTDGTYSDTLMFGSAATATYCLGSADSALGETELPPEGPSDVYDARFTDIDGFSCKGQGVAVDLRPLGAGYYASQSYKLHLHAGGNGTHGDSVVVSWTDSLGAWNGGYCTLVDYLTGGSSVDINLTTVSGKRVVLKSADYLIYTGDATTYLSFDYSRLTIADHNAKGKVQAANSPGGKKSVTTPNIFNLGAFSFPKGATGFTVGSDPIHSVLVAKWATVTASSYAKGVKWTATSTGQYSSRCLDSTGIVKKAGKNMTYVKKQLKELEPGKDQVDNWLFAQLLTLHATLQMYKEGVLKPGGFDSLTLASGPYAGWMVSKLVTHADSVISCEGTGSYVPFTDAVGAPDSLTFAELATQLQSVNDAFTMGGNGAADTATLNDTAGTNWNSGKGKFVTIGGNVSVAAQSTLNRPTTDVSINRPHAGKSMIESASKPQHFTLDQNYPNPFNPTTEIRFSLSTPAMVSLKVYNILGQLVTTLANNEQFGASEQNITFNANNYASGTYFYTLRVNDLKTGALMFTDVKKMVLIK